MEQKLLGKSFLSRLETSGLLPPEKIMAIVRKYDLADEEDPQRIGKSFIHEKVLTRYQVERIFQGSWRALVIDHYHVTGVVGAGGMGWVYSAKDTESGWEVALKVLASAERYDAAMRARLRLEAQAGLRLKHPNILRTISLNDCVDQQGEFSYVVLELVRGITPLELQALNKCIDWKQACDIAMQTAIGLQYAHEAGLVHRDVKPENLMLRTNGSIKILDFGLAMVDENDEEFAMAMIFGQDRLGTADYVAPEQTINSYRVDARADIYSLGCTLYYLLTGSVPFPGKSTVMKVEGHQRHRIELVRKLRPEVPERLELIVRKMTAKRPENRIQTAAEVASLLKPFAQRLQLDFDYDRVLKARLKHAKQRLTMRELQRRTAARQSTPDPPDVDESMVKTELRDDTHVDRAQ